MMLLRLVVALGLARLSSAVCAFKSGNYELQWIVDSQTASVYFNLTYLNFPTGSFTGVGFGDNMASGLDVILVAIPQGSTNPQVIDASVTGYTEPKRDANSDLAVRSTSYVNQVLRAELTRPLNGIDASDRSLDGCVMWNFITSPGEAKADGGFGKHSGTPEQQRQCDITSRCQGTIPSAFIPTSSQQGQLNQNQMGYQNSQNNPYPPQYGPNQQQPYSPFIPGYNPNYPSPLSFTSTSIFSVSEPAQNQNNRQFQPSNQQYSNQFNQNQMYGPNQQSQFNQNQYGQQPQFSQNYNSQQSGQGYNQQYSNQNQYQVGSGASRNSPYYDPYNNQQSNYGQSNINVNRLPNYGRKKRQANTNIYGYDTNSASQPSGLSLVQNPNYQFLPNQLADQYARTYSQATAQYDPTTGRMRDNGRTLATQPPILSNDQQNSANYQQIQRDSAAGRYNIIPPTDNIYGYGYSSTPSTGFLQSRG